MDQNNEHLHAWSGYSKHNFSCKGPSVQNTCQELAMRGIIALRVVLVDEPEYSSHILNAAMCVPCISVDEVSLFLDRLLTLSLNQGGVLIAFPFSVSSQVGKTPVFAEFRG